MTTRNSSIQYQIVPNKMTDTVEGHQVNSFPPWRLLLLIIGVLFYIQYVHTKTQRMYSRTNTILIQY